MHFSIITLGLLCISLNALSMIPSENRIVWRTEKTPKLVCTKPHGANECHITVRHDAKEKNVYVIPTDQSLFDAYFDEKNKACVVMGTRCSKLSLIASEPPYTKFVQYPCYVDVGIEKRELMPLGSLLYTAGPLCAILKSGSVLELSSVWNPLRAFIHCVSNQYHNEVNISLPHDIMPHLCETYWNIINKNNDASSHEFIYGSSFSFRKKNTCKFLKNINGELHTMYNTATVELENAEEAKPRETAVTIVCNQNKYSIKELHTCLPHLRIWDEEEIYTSLNHYLYEARKQQI